MNSALGVSKHLIWNKFKLMSFILLVNIIELVLLVPLDWGSMFLQSYPLGKVIFSSLIVYLLGALFLIRENEQVFLNSKYSLIPVTEIKIYFSNLITTFLAYLYFWILETSIFLTAFWIIDNDSLIFHLQSIVKMGQIDLIIKAITMSLLAIILIWTLSTFVHLVSQLLPLQNQKLTTVIFYLLVAAMVFYIGYINIWNLDTMRVDWYIEVKNHIFGRTVGFDLIGIVVLTVLNIMILKKYSSIK
ncbi:hypothetical protein [Companilactobacillus bobalius]|uniref:Uncharacterized protein n=2 Tax=Companilactobacillus bobalius TaxID=2801451 RepID=A0A202FAA9_9LACO|nr:hypothetical protein [Companilactobacillus bobalius]KAE9564242.1 hypothetical protein ATN92_00755 [Companilactobacillus bobalius]KRK83945.1 hypothetical protein FC78_GL000948 [Companilactobacillus bobalius DSM 19674]OVE97368.1 hypothetical protein LKACC16343_01858 [Companilactobacillus bobalius]GEO58243.1 hypothetical protein LBO01_13720 [Companilactobacillus paralimentarius]